MTNMFKPKMPDMAAQERSMERQEEILQQQQERLERETADERKKLAARIRSRRSGGYRSLLSPSRSFGLSGVDYE